MKGTTIKFTTDEYGKIVKYDNLDKIAKQAKQLFMSVVKECQSLTVLMLWVLIQKAVKGC